MITDKENLEQLEEQAAEFVTETLPRGANHLAAAIGRGLIAGLLGTAAITLSQMIEMKLTGRNKSEAPAEAVEKTMPVEAPADEEEKQQLSQLTHWGYGTSWGMARGVLDELGIHGWAATAVHYAAITGTAFVMLPGLNVAPPLRKWKSKDIVTDLVHHAVYATVAGLVYDALKSASYDGGSDDFDGTVPGIMVETYEFEMY